MTSASNLKIALTALALTAACPLSDAQAEDAGATVTVTFNNVKTDRGRLFVEICTAEEYEARPKKPCALRWTLPAETPETALTAENVPPGEYALQVYHDVNDDGRMKTGMFGIPREPIGASNDARGRRGPPSFEDMAFDVISGSSVRMTVNLYKV